MDFPAVTDILLARPWHGKISYAIMREVAEDWKARADALGPFAFMVLEEGEADKLDIVRVAAYADSRADLSLEQIVERLYRRRYGT